MFLATIAAPARRAVNAESCACMVPMRARVHVAPGSVAPGQHKIHFVVHAHDDPRVYVREKSVFIVR